MGLLWVCPSQGWQHNHRGGHYTSGYDDAVGKQYNPAEDKVGKVYHTIHFGTPNHMDNAIVIHAPEYCLPIGVMRSFDKETGWIV